jgi:ABC-2 type transport system ATP-binding protein
VYRLAAPEFEPDMNKAPSSAPVPAIEVKGLDKVYPGGKKTGPKHALKGIDLTISRGAMFGLLGPNGAGKSTFINILAGLVRKTGGKANIWGFDVDVNPRNARNAIGVVTQEVFIDAFFTPFETLELQAGLYGVPKHERRTMEILKMMRLEKEAHVYARTLSGGMKRRLMVAKAMVHAPPVLVLDEPTAGVDVELRHELWDNVRALHDQGVTIVLTTHYLEEAEELCDTIAIINHGRVIACEPKPKILARIEEKEVVIELKRPLHGVPDAFKTFNASLLGPRTLRLHVSKGTHSMGEVLAALQRSNLEVADLRTTETDLEDIFIQLTRASAE